jgi:methylmalonyl-CoA mutase cobalamin-binding domain/chain
MADSATHAASRNEIVLAMRQRTKAFSTKQGRRPRVLVTQMQAPVRSHVVEQVAALLADLGFDVDINPSMQQVEQVARMAMENDVHAIVVLSAMSREKGPYLKRLTDLLESAHYDSILLAVCNRQGLLQRADMDGVVNLNSLDAEAAQRLLEEIERAG